jgi:hypothetical protein
LFVYSFVILYINMPTNLFAIETIINPFDPQTKTLPNRVALMNRVMKQLKLKVIS